MLGSHERVFLIGYRGAGKSSVAQLLAPRLGWLWLDADEVLEKRFGRSIARIFTEEGENGFREKESLILGELCCLSRRVIATGGGVVLRDENRRRLQTCGLVVWLTADADTIAARLHKDAAACERRPQLTVGGRAEIDELLGRREPLYRACADFTIDTTRHSIEEIAEQVERWVREAAAKTA